MVQNRVVYLILFSLVVLFALFIWMNNTRSAQCLRQDKAFKEELVGVLKRKYLDKANHAYETIEISMVGTSRQTNFFLFEKSGAYDYLLPGDSIVKPSMSLRLEVVRSGISTSFDLWYGCEEDHK